MNALDQLENLMSRIRRCDDEMAGLERTAKSRNPPTFTPKEQGQYRALFEISSELMEQHRRIRTASKDN